MLQSIYLKAALYSLLKHKHAFGKYNDYKLAAFVMVVTAITLTSGVVDISCAPCRFLFINVF